MKRLVYCLALFVALSIAQTTPPQCYADETCVDQLWGDYGHGGAPFTVFGQTTYWFSTTNGDTTCHANLTSAAPLAFSYHCWNLRGSNQGSYTATGNLATDVITVGLSGPPGTSLCMFAVNATASPVALGSFSPSPIPPGTISWSCSTNGQNAGNSGTLAIPRGKE
jgi:hypothetical protein